MIRRWLPCGMVGMILVASAVLGCGGGDVTSHPSTRYSPESLAEELVFRYKALDPARRNEPRSRPAAAVAKVSPKEAKVQTKDTPAATLDDLVRETAEKAATIPDLSQAQALGRVAEAVGKDASIGEADRRTIVDRLQARGG